jgi:hypothetical protein
MSAGIEAAARPRRVRRNPAEAEAAQTKVQTSQSKAKRMQALGALRLPRIYDGTCNATAVRAWHRAGAPGSDMHRSGRRVPPHAKEPRGGRSWPELLVLHSWSRLD